MPSAVEYQEQSGIYLVIVGSVFWISAIIGYLFVILANIKRREFITDKYDGNLSMNCRIGIITFFDNVPATVAGDFADLIKSSFCSGVKSKIEALKEPAQSNDSNISTAKSYCQYEINHVSAAIKDEEKK